MCFPAKGNIFSILVRAVSQWTPEDDPNRASPATSADRPWKGHDSGRASLHPETVGNGSSRRLDLDGRHDRFAKQRSGDGAVYVVFGKQSRDADAGPTF
jgi:hypothetical protein